MELSSLFSLIFASILGLLPILFIIGRRAKAKNESNGAGRPAGAQATAAPIEPHSEQASILSRIVRRDASGSARPPARSAGRSAPPKPSMQPSGPAPGTDGERGFFATVGTDSPERSSAAKRIGQLTEAQRAIVYAEILGPPVGLRDQNSFGGGR